MFKFLFLDFLFMNKIQSNKKKKKHAQVIKVMVIAASACLFVSGAYFLIDARGGFAESQVRATISGPDQIDAGQTEQFEVIIANNSDRSIKVGKIRVKLYKKASERELSTALEFADDGTKEKRFEGTTIEPGSEFRELIRVTSVRSEEEAEIRVEYDYSPQDLSVQFFAKGSHNLVIGSLEAQVDFQLPEIAFVGEPVKGSISITPRASFEEDDLYMVLTTTGDFDITSAIPRFADNNRLRWSLDRFQSGITQNFSFIGTSDSADSVNVSVEIGRYEGLVFRPLSLNKKKVSISHIPLLVLVEPKAKTTSVTSQERVAFDVVVSNKGDTDLKDIVIEVQLPTQIMAKGSFVSRPHGNSLLDNDTIAQISHQSSSALDILAPGEQETIEFSFQLKDFATLTPAIKKQYAIKVEVEGVTNNGSNISNEYETEIALEGTTKLTQKILRNTALIQGGGTVPPVVGESTGYVVVWELKNDINNLQRTQVKASVPGYVEYRGIVKPVDQNIEYDPLKNTITWNIGEFADSERTVHFEVWVTPNQEQVGRPVSIVSHTRFTADNPVTKEPIDEGFSNVTTALPDDATVSLIEGIVEE